MLPKVVKQNEAHELFMNMYIVIIGQWYYYIHIFTNIYQVKCNTLNELITIRACVIPKNNNGILH